MSIEQNNKDSLELNNAEYLKEKFPEISHGLVWLYLKGGYEKSQQKFDAFQWKICNILKENNGSPESVVVVQREIDKITILAEHNIDRNATQFAASIFDIADGNIEEEQSSNIKPETGIT